MSPLEKVHGLTETTRSRSPPLNYSLHTFARGFPAAPPAPARGGAGGGGEVGASVYES